LVVVPIVVVVV